MLSGNPIFELLEVGTLAGLKSGLGVGHAVHLQRPGVVRAEVEEVPKLGVITSGLQDVAIVDVRVGHHRRDHILKTLVVRLELVQSQNVGDGITVLVVVLRRGKPIEKDDIQCDLSFIVNKLEALLDCRDGVKAHCGATIGVHSSVNNRRKEKSREGGRGDDLLGALLEDLVLGDRIQVEAVVFGIVCVHCANH